MDGNKHIHNISTFSFSATKLPLLQQDQPQPYRFEDGRGVQVNFNYLFYMEGGKKGPFSSNLYYKANPPTPLFQMNSSISVHLTPPMMIDFKANISDVKSATSSQISTR